MRRSTELQPFRGYIGSRFQLCDTTAEIVDITVRGHTVCFVGRKAGSDLEFLVPLRYLLDNVIEEQAAVSAAGC
jgi:hypothetical protein